MAQKIIFVAHCVLNTASKVVLYDSESIAAEEALRIQFLDRCLHQGVQIIQLPCPEFTLYGANRWGHVSNQFDNPFFRRHCREKLMEVIPELQEYMAHPDRFSVLGVVGIDGSPSCGVDYTSCGDWYGSFGHRENLAETLQSAHLASKSGIFMEVLMELLREYSYDQEIPVVGLFAPEPWKCIELLQ